MTERRRGRVSVPNNSAWSPWQPIRNEGEYGQALEALRQCILVTLPTLEPPVVPDPPRPEPTAAQPT